MNLKKRDFYRDSHEYQRVSLVMLVFLTDFTKTSIHRKTNKLEDLQIIELTDTKRDTFDLNGPFEQSMTTFGAYIALWNMTAYWIFIYVR